MELNPMFDIVMTILMCYLPGDGQVILHGGETRYYGYVFSTKVIVSSKMVGVMIVNEGQH